MLDPCPILREALGRNTQVTWAHDSSAAAGSKTKECSGSSTVASYSPHLELTQPYMTYSAVTNLPRLKGQGIPNHSPKPLPLTDKQQCDIVRKSRVMGIFFSHIVKNLICSPWYLEKLAIIILGCYLQPHMNLSVELTLKFIFYSFSVQCTKAQIKQLIFKYQKKRREIDETEWIICYSILRSERQITVSPRNLCKAGSREASSTQWYPPCKRS